MSDSAMRWDPEHQMWIAQFSKCAVCDRPMSDHVPLRRVLKTWLRHVAVRVFSWIMGRLPLATDEPSW